MPATNAQRDDERGVRHDQGSECVMVRPRSVWSKGGHADSRDASPGGDHEDGQADRDPSKEACAAS
jgi:hypothetical protein